MEAFKNKIIIVTGGANGIGKGIAQCFLKQGATVIVADKDENAGNRMLEECSNISDSIHFYQIDLCDDSSVLAFMKWVKEGFKSIDVLVCNAGIQIRNWAIDFPMEQFDLLMNLNLRAYYLCAKTAAGYMREQENGGSIICISSVNGEKYHSKRSPYNISKAAINGLVGTLAVEWGRYGIRVNGVAPGYVITELMKSGIREGLINEKQIMSVIPLKRYITVEEVGNAVTFLASDMASGITGQIINVDGGWSKNAIPEEENLE